MKIIDVRHDYIEPDPENPNEMDEAQLKALREEIKLRGFVQPVLVRPTNPDDDGEPRYQIVDGEHRWRILGELGAETVPCVVDTKASEIDAQIRMVTMNRLRGRFVPIKLAHLLADLAETMPESEIAKRLALDRTDLRNYLDLAGYMDPQQPAPPQAKSSEPDNSVEVVVVATQEQARQIDEALEELTGGDQDAIPSVLAKAARDFRA